MQLRANSLRAALCVLVMSAAVACGNGSADPDAGVDAGGAAPLNATGCGEPGADTVLFCLANANAGVPEIRNDFFGSGAAMFDADGDGDLDIFAGGDVFASVFLRNDGAGRFSDDTQTVGLGSLREVHGIVAGDNDNDNDNDNDGDLDLYLTRQAENLLFLNDGGVFEDVTATAGVGDARWGTTASFGDYDGDGLLDLAVANWADFLGTSEQQPNVLYHNEGDGSFRDVTAETGVAGDGFTNVVSFTDYDGDGDMDLLAGNDFGVLSPPNVAWRNDGAGSTVDAHRCEHVDGAGLRPLHDDHLERRLRPRRRPRLLLHQYWL